MRKIYIRKDISNNRFGMLTALYPTDKRRNRSVVWHCKCDCGNEIELTVGALSYAKSCGCYKNNSQRKKFYNYKDFTDQVYGTLTVLYPTEERFHRSIIWHCRCECGNELDVPSGYLVKYKSRKCKCLK